MSKNRMGGRPPVAAADKKDKRLTLYLSDNDLKNLNKVRVGIVKYSPTLSLNDFFRMIINNFDDTLIPYLEESENSEVKRYMQKILYSDNLFGGHYE